MGFLSSLFGSPPNIAHRFADLCLMVRQDGSFLRYYAEQGFESGVEAQRLEFNKDILMLFLADAIFFMRVADRPRVTQLNREMRARYLSLLSVPETSPVGNCI